MTDLSVDDPTAPDLSRTPEEQRRYDLYAGLALAVGAAVLFGCTFLTRTSVPLTIQGSILVYGAVGLAVAFGFLRVRDPQDFYGGMALVGLALIAFVASNELPGTRGFAFGPGTAPRLFAGMLGVLSLLVAINGLVKDGPAITKYNLRGLFFILASILIFAGLVRPMGLVIAAFLTIVASSLATKDFIWWQTVIWGAVLTAFVSILFPYGLNLPFQLWPRFLLY